MTMALQQSPFTEVDSRAEKLVGAYRDAESQLQSIVARAVIGNRVSRRDSSRAKATARHAIGLLEAKSRPQAAALLRLAYVRGARLVDPEARLDQHSLYAVGTFTDSLNTKLAAAAVVVANNVNDVFRRLTLQSVARQLSGDDAEPLVAIMKATGTTGFVDRTGRRWGLEQYAQTAIRTISRQTATEATLSAMMAANHDVVKVPHTSKPSPQCQKWDGGTFSLNGETPGLEVITTLPPFHPNCEHWIEPVI